MVYMGLIIKGPPSQKSPPTIIPDEMQMIVPENH